MRTDGKAFFNSGREASSVVSPFTPPLNSPRSALGYRPAPGLHLARGPAAILLNFRQMPGGLDIEYISGNANDRFGPGATIAASSQMWHPSASSLTLWQGSHQSMQALLAHSGHIGETQGMALSQIQIIQSLAEALSWFEKELNWGVPQAELRHLSGRIGELYAAMITRGQMALAVNQQGYDVVSAEGERISVKTITTSSNVTFNPETFNQVDRVIVLRIVVEENEVSIEELLDCSAADACSLMGDASGRLSFSIAKRSRGRDLSELRVTEEGLHRDMLVKQFENGTIVVERSGKPETPAKPALRQIASEIGVDILNSNGNPKNTRSLGADVLTVLRTQNAR